MASMLPNPAQKRADADAASVCYLPKQRGATRKCLMLGIFPLLWLLVTETAVTVQTPCEPGCTLLCICISQMLRGPECNWGPAFSWQCPHNLCPTACQRLGWKPGTRTQANMWQVELRGRETGRGKPALGWVGARGGSQSVLG